VSAPVPARTWHSSYVPEDGGARFSLNLEETVATDVEVQLWIGDPGDGVTVLLDRAQTGELVTDLLRRLALIGGRYAAVRAAADSSIDHQRGPQPTDHAWTVTDDGRDALRGPEGAGTDPTGGLPPIDPCSSGSGSAGGAR
jgi:hypothetical protein